MSSTSLSPLPKHVLEHPTSVCGPRSGRHTRGSSNSFGKSQSRTMAISDVLILVYTVMGYFSVRFVFPSSMSMKVPSIVSEAKRALSEGLAVVIGLQTTGEVGHTHHLASLTLDRRLPDIRVLYSHSLAWRMRCRGWRGTWTPLCPSHRRFCCGFCESTFPPPYTPRYTGYVPVV